MAESVCAHMIRLRGLEDKIQVSSAAAHTDEIGNPPHRGTWEKLAQEGIPLVPHRARLMRKEDGENYDYLIAMDEYNVRDMKRIVGREYEQKVRLLLSFTRCSRAISDPWYTGNFDETFADVTEGCAALLDYLKEK